MLSVFDSPLLRQYAVVIVVNLSVLATGIGIVWPSPVLVKLSNSTESVLSRPITAEEGSWIVSIGSLSGIAVNFMSAYLVDRIGRKYCVILYCLPKLVVGFMFIYATEVWMLLVARAILGVADSGVFTAVPMYASEVASKEIRGSLGTILQILCSIGVVIMLSIGPFTSYFTLNVVYTCVIVLTTLPLLLLPDSPYFLYSKGKKEESLKVLTFLRGSETQAHEELKEYEASSKTNVKINKKDIITDRLFLKSLLLVVVIVGIASQLVGFNAVSFYLQTILESTQTTVRPEVASVVIGLIQLSASFCTTLVTDRFGRKPIMIGTNAGMAVGMLGLGVFFKLKETMAVTGFLNYVPLISLILVVSCFSAGMLSAYHVGFGSLNWVLGAELFDDHSRGTGMSITMIVASIFMFILTKYFAIVTQVIGPAATYWIFSMNCVLTCFFIKFCIPETKGKSFAEIQDILGGKNVKKDDVKC